MKNVKIEMIHDLVCSWCPIGYSNLKNAIEALKEEINVELKFLPFELHPDISIEGEEIKELLTSKFGWDEDQHIKYRANLVEVGSKSGVTFNFNKRTHYFNTYYGHIAMHWAESFNAQEKLNSAMIEAYFENGDNVGDLNQLNKIINSIGLDAKLFNKYIKSDDFKSTMKSKYDKVAQYNIQSIPSFIINEKSLIKGSNTIDFFVNLIRESAV